MLAAAAAQLAAIGVVVEQQQVLIAMVVVAQRVRISCWPVQHVVVVVLEKSEEREMNWLINLRIRGENK